MSIEAKIHNRIEKLTPEFINFLQELVKIPSVTGEEQECQKFIKDKMIDSAIFDKEIFPQNVSPFLTTDRLYNDRPCIVGKISGQGDSNFIINAHIDTAPVEDENSWGYPPFSAVINDNKLYGRGALDDKAGIAMMLMIADCFTGLDINFPGDIYFQSVIEDEDSGNGTLACTLDGYRCDAAIVIDGTWPYRVIDSHLGQLWINFVVSGIPAAACSHKNGINPIDVSFELINQLKQRVDKKNQEINQWLNIENPFFINVGKINSGVWAGAVPEHCSFSIQTGFPPPYTPDLILDDISSIATNLSKEKKVNINFSVGNLSTVPFSNYNNRMVDIIKNIVPRTVGNDMPVLNNAVTGHCDLRHILTADNKPANAILYGPGGGKNPHINNEYYMIDHFVPVAKTICSAILEWYQMND